MSSALQDRLSSFRGGASVVVSDPVSNAVLYSNRPDRLIVTASLYKLAVLIEAERRVEVGAMRYSTPVKILPQDITADGSYVAPGTVLPLHDALELMTTYSDNGTALALLRALGPANINATLLRSGIRPFHVALGPWEDNSASASAVASVFNALAKRTLISPAASDRMLARLARQHVNDRLPAKLPAGTVVAHKTGNLGFVTHDAGIIYGPRQAPIVVVAMTWGTVERVAVDLIADIGRLVYEHGFYRPPSVGLGAPDLATGQVGRSLVLMVRATNLSERSWSLGDPHPLGLVWEMRDGSGTPMVRSARPLPLGALGPGESIELPVVVEAPGQEGDYSLTFEIASPAFGAITDLGTPSSTAILRARAIPAELVESPFAATDRAAAPSDGATAQSSLGTALAPAVAAAASLPLAALALRATLHRRRPLRLLSSGTRAAVSVLALAASALAELWS